MQDPSFTKAFTNENTHYILFQRLICFFKIFQIIGVVCALQLGYILSKDDARDDISAVARRQKDALQLSIYEKSRRDLPPPMGPVSPTAPGHRLLKTAPPPPPSMMPKWQTISF